MIKIKSQSRKIIEVVGIKFSDVLFEALNVILTICFVIWSKPNV